MRNAERTVGVGDGLPQEEIYMTGSSRMSWKLQQRTVRRVWRLRVLTLRIDNTLLLIGQGKFRACVTLVLRALMGLAGGGRSNSDELTAAAFRSILFIKKDSAEHDTTIPGSAGPSSTASFPSSSSM